MGIRRALLVGINYPGTSYPLQGCVNDVNLMADVLTQHYGFTDATQRRMLTDHSATTDNILERLNWLVDGVEPGDVLYFHFSGHGSQMVNQSYDVNDVEPDAKDEIICPMDLDWREKVIRDDDLKAIFDRVPNGVSLTVVLDCCNSGSGLDQEEQYQPFGLGEAREFTAPPEIKKIGDTNRWLPMPDDIANRARGLDIDVKPRSVQSRDVNQTGMLITGCQSHQTSADAWIDGNFYGAATYYLADALAKNAWSASHIDIVTQMNESMIKYGYSQRPQLDGSADLYETKFLEPLVVGTGLDEPATAPIEVVELEGLPEGNESTADDDKDNTKKWVAAALIVAAIVAAVISLS